jgi:hypothetical protein
MKKDIFIHIGKCGGSTVRTAISNYTEIHLKTIKYSKDDNYIIVLRNPIDRFKSAFYYRKLIHKKSITKKYLNIETKMFSQVNDIYDFTENLFEYDLKDINGIAHIGENIDYYLSPIIDFLNTENVKYIFTSHFLDEELKKINPNYKSKKLKDNSSNKPSKKLSDLSLKNLNEFLKKDFEIIEKLNDKGLLSNRQYEILSKKDGW